VRLEEEARTRKRAGMQGLTTEAIKKKDPVERKKRVRVFCVAVRGDQVKKKVRVLSGDE
jgi:hypothetical protein